MKVFVAVGFLIILLSLGSAFFFMMRDKSKTNRTANALTVRIGASILLFLLILTAYALGWIEPTGIR